MSTAGRVGRFLVPAVSGDVQVILSCSERTVFLRRTMELVREKKTGGLGLYRGVILPVCYIGINNKPL